MALSGWSGERVIWCWLVVAGLVAAAYVGLPRYLGSLERRIVFAAPDCIEVTVDRVVGGGLTLEERVDSTELWTKGCLEDRQNEMLRIADLIGWTTNVVLGLGGLLALWATGGWLRTRWSILRRDGAD